MSLAAEIESIKEIAQQVWESKYWYIPFLPILFAIGMAVVQHIGQKKNPYYLQLINIKGKKKYKEVKSNPNLFSFFKSIIFGTLALYYIIIGLGFTFFSMLALVYLAKIHLSLDFQTYPWKWFGLMFNGMGAIFIVYCAGFFNYLFWLGILPNTIDKIVGLFSTSLKRN
jgi:hypothetical protein